MRQRIVSFIRQSKRLQRVALVIVVAGVAVSLIGFSSRAYQFWDDEPDRGAIPMPDTDAFGDSFNRVAYLPQGWDAADSLWFYNTTQGSNLMPYDFLQVLETPDSTERFMDNQRVNKYRFLAQKPTFSNPDGLPVGFVLDTYKGQEYVGFTCAACHTGQVNYRGTGIRIDGGPSGADLEKFVDDVARALRATQSDADKKGRFTKAVLARGNYDTEKAVLDDLAKFAQRTTSYAVINNPSTPYRYGRLDAFGRIYNRLLEHVMSGPQLSDILSEILTPDELKEVMHNIGEIVSDDDRDHIIERIQPFLTIKQQLRLRNAIFNTPNAPVSYPFLWDIPQHDYVQWNGLVANAGVGPIGRNAGEVIGVFATLDWRPREHTTLSSLIARQAGGVAKVNFESSTNVRNLRRLERHLVDLQSPEWPEPIFGALDQQRIDRGAQLYARHCLSCHDRIDRASPERRVVAQMTDVDAVGTDPQMARNGMTYQGYSGILRNLYVNTGVGDILIERKAPVAALLTATDINVVATPDADKWIVQAWAERAYDFIVSFADNEIKTSIKQGRYVPDTTAAPFASINAYKARPLNGIWATAPYLHNGSVPTLYDLLLPAREEGDPADGEYRPETFRVGAREFDPVKVGFRSDVGDFFDTRFRGNSNKGHDYGSRATTVDGKTVPALTREERLDLLEFLKKQ
jgi:hypothetical protein